MVKLYRVTKGYNVILEVLIEADTVEDAESIAGYLSYDSSAWKVNHAEHNYAMSIDEIEGE